MSLKASRGQSSLKDVAERAGVSLATVSRVLSNANHPMNERTKEKVLQAAKELGYTPNAIARALVTKVSRTIGVIIGDITDSYFAEIVRGVEDVARSHEYITVVCNAERNPNLEIKYARMLLEQNAAAVILAGGFFPALTENSGLNEVMIQALRRTKVICLADRGLPEVPVITVDDRAIVADLVRHLVGLGHKQIAYIGGPPGFSVSIDREAGFVEAMRSAGLDPSLIVPGGFGLEFGRAAASALLAKGLPQAVIAASDDTAIGLLTSLRDAGVRVPEDISVVGIDDAKYSRLFNLTTVQLPSYTLGASAARRALELDPYVSGSRDIFLHRVVVRGSSSWTRPDKSSG